MKYLIILLPIFFLVNPLNAQNLSFGLDFKSNNNIVQRDTKKGLFYASDPYYSYTPWYETENGVGLLDLYIPDYDFSAIDDFGDTIHFSRSGFRINDNFEIPIYARFTSKHNWFIDLRFSSTKYTLEFEGDMFQDDEYYQWAYGTVDDFQAAYGGQYQDDTAAFVNWFNQEVKNDPWSKAEMKYVEEFKYRSLFLGFGYKFLPHKSIRPYLYGGLGYRATVSNYKRQFFDIDENNLGTTESVRNVTNISKSLPTVLGSTSSFKGGLGFEFHRYHFGMDFEYTWVMESHFGSDLGGIHDYSLWYDAMSTVSFYVGADLFSIDLNSKSYKKEVYDSEFESLTSSYRKNRKWAFGLRVEAPIAAQVSSLDNFSVILLNEKIDPETGYYDFLWQSIAFRGVTKVNWSPKFGALVRYSPVNRIDLEFEMAYSQVTFDNAVQEFNTIFHYDTSSFEYYYDYSFTKVNDASYRTTMQNLNTNLKCYYTLVQNSLLDVRLYAGAGFTFFTYPWGGTDKDVGVNGKGNDVYSAFNDHQNGFLAFSEDDVYVSTFADDVDFENQSADQMLDNFMDYYGDGGHSGQSIEDWNRTSWPEFYGTIHAGAEVEINRFLLGISTEFTLGKVDGILLNNYYNINGTIGYLLFTKNRLNN